MLKRVTEAEARIIKALRDDHTRQYLIDHFMEFSAEMKETTERMMEDKATINDAEVFAEVMGEHLALKGAVDNLLDDLREMNCD